MPVVLETLSQGQKLAHSMVAELSNHRQTVVYRELSRPADLQAATDLIVGEYIAKGYLPTSNPQLSKQKMLESLRSYRMFGALKQGQLVAVLGLTTTPILPLEAVFSKEIAVFRAHGYRVGEIGKFASVSEYYTIAMGLMVVVVQVANGYLDVIVQTVNPKHEGFYTKIAHFQHLSTQPRPLPSVCNAPAIGLYAEPSQVLTCSRARKSFRFA